MVKSYCPTRNILNYETFHALPCNLKVKNDHYLNFFEEEKLQVYGFSLFSRNCNTIFIFLEGSKLKEVSLARKIVPRVTVQIPKLKIYFFTNEPTMN